MNKPFLILLLLTLFFKYSFTQNLVINPSFEDTLCCPVGLDDLNCVGTWTNPTRATPGYFNSCSVWQAGVPQNDVGLQFARTGSAYAGGHTSDFTSTDYREYIQGKFISPLEEGKHYEVSFYVSLADSSTKACDNIGAYLHANAFSVSNNLNLPFTPQVVSPSNQPITDVMGWTQVVDTIIATGGEQYITIGVFTNNTSTNWVNVLGGWMSEPFYYIDDVSVIKIEKTYPNVFTPNNDNINDFWIPILISENDIITIYNRWGQKITTLNYINNKWDGKNQKGKECPSGVYYFITNTNEKGFIQLVR